MTPINQHSILSDQHTAALVDNQGSIVWYCPERIDSAPLFGALLGDTAGRFSIAPAGRSDTPVQRYGDRDLVLATTWDGLRVTDCLVVGSSAPVLVRRVQADVEAHVVFEPRVDFGRTPTTVLLGNAGELVIDNQFVLRCSAPVRWELVESASHTTASAALVPGSTAYEFSLAAVDAPALSGDPIAETVEFWERWCEPFGDVSPELRRHGLILGALNHRETGAFVAAATTSLPEFIGGVRNWDYRYCWLRDGAMTASTLTRLGRSDDGQQFLDWVARLLAEPGASADHLRPLYLVDGGALPPEADVEGVAGYGGSLPVRTGNGADSQVQLDVFGPIAVLASRVAEQTGGLRAKHLDVLAELAGAVTRRWDEADHGIWEARRSPREYTYTRVMCWLTLDKTAELFVAAGRPVPDEWRQVRDLIAERTVAEAWKPERSTFGTATDADDVDAAILALGWAGLVDRTSAQWSTTIDTVIADLGAGTTIKRYHYDDGLPGDEGGFHLMTSWVVDELLAAGRTAEARVYFDALREQQGPTGMLSEEVEATNGMALGNVPQAYTHLGVVENLLNWPELGQ